MSTFSGVLVPALTPFNDNLSVNTRGFVSHCKWLLDQGANGLAVFGTTSEANSLSKNERMRLLEALVENDIPADKLMPGTGACALMDAVDMTAHAVELGCGGVLMLPPFYYKGVSDDGLFASFAETIERVGSGKLKVYLYHIPPVAQVPISVELVGRLIEAYPETVVGLKDSSGDWSNTKALLDAYPGFATFAGSEVFLLDCLRAGGAGSITATGNVNCAGIAKVVANWQSDQADALQDEITTVRKTIQAYPVIPALKRMIAKQRAAEGWRITRPPLEALDDARFAHLETDLAEIGFELPPAGSQAAQAAE
jgi:4-hydroxy-tetrahydrodipicolinate synthase